MEKGWGWRRNGLLANLYLFLKKAELRTSWEVEPQLPEGRGNTCVYVCACARVCMYIRDALWEQSMVSGAHMSSLLLRAP